MYSCALSIPTGNSSLPSGSLSAGQESPLPTLDMEVEDAAKTLISFGGRSNRPAKKQKIHGPNVPDQYSQPLKAQMQLLPPQLLSFWKDLASLVRAGTSWKQVFYGDNGSKLDPNSYLVKFMDMVQKDIIGGNDYLTSILNSVQKARDKFTPFLEKTIRQGKDWKEALNSPEYLSTAKKASMAEIQKQAELIRAGLSGWEALALIFVKKAQVFVTNSGVQKGTPRTDVGTSIGQLKVPPPEANQTSDRPIQPIQSIIKPNKIESDSPKKVSWAEQRAARATPNISEQPPNNEQFLSDFWHNFEQIARRGIPWQQAIFGKTENIPQINPKLASFIGKLCMQMKFGEGYLEALSTVMLSDQSVAEHLKEFRAMQNLIHDGNDWKAVMLGQEHIFDGHPVLGTVKNSAEKIAQEIAKGKFWWNAAAAVFAQYPPFVKIPKFMSA